MPLPVCYYAISTTHSLSNPGNVRDSSLDMEIEQWGLQISYLWLVMPLVLSDTI